MTRDFFMPVDLRALLQYVTGLEIVKKKSIKFAFNEDDYGVITAHTCGTLITFPRRVFQASEDSYAKFAMAMKCTAGDNFSGLRFNTV